MGERTKKKLGQKRTNKWCTRQTLTSSWLMPSLSPSSSPQPSAPVLSLSMTPQGPGHPDSLGQLSWLHPLPAHPASPASWKLKHPWLCKGTAQQQLKQPRVITVTFLLIPKHSTVAATMKINSVPAESWTRGQGDYAQEIGGWKLGIWEASIKGIRKWNMEHGKVKSEQAHRLPRQFVNESYTIRSVSPKMLLSSWHCSTLHNYFTAIPKTFLQL